MAVTNASGGTAACSALTTAPASSRCRRQPSRASGLASIMWPNINIASLASSQRSGITECRRLNGTTAHPSIICNCTRGSSCMNNALKLRS
ncbi:hypothetical protein D3C73_1488090 [compost metagenome]